MAANQYYCHACAKRLWLLSSHSETTDFTGSLGSYTLEKFLKHTVPYSGVGTISIFSQPDYQNYKDYIINTQASGSVEFDSQGRKNIIWAAGSNTGITFKNGGIILPNDAIKVVCSDHIFTIHAYPTSSFAMSLQKCEECGQDVFS